MIEKLAKFYKDNVITYKLVFTEMRFTYFIFLFLVFALAFSSLNLVWNLLLHFHLKTEIQSSILSFFCILVMITAMFFLLNGKAKKIVRKKFNLRIKSFTWRTEQFDSIQSNILIGHLQEKNLYTEEKLKQIIDLIYKEIERKKLPSLIAPTIFVSLFVPIWVQYLTFVFREIKDTQSAVAIAGSLTFLLILVMIAISFSRWILKETFEFLWISDSLIKQNLANKLEEILVEYKESSDAPRV